MEQNHDRQDLRCQQRQERDPGVDSMSHHTHPERTGQTRDIEQRQASRHAGRGYRSIGADGREIRPQCALPSKENKQGSNCQ